MMSAGCFEIKKNQFDNEMKRLESIKLKLRQGNHCYVEELGFKLWQMATATKNLCVVRKCLTRMWFSSLVQVAEELDEKIIELIETEIGRRLYFQSSWSVEKTKRMWKSSSPLILITILIRLRQHKDRNTAPSRNNWSASRGFWSTSRYFILMVYLEGKARSISKNKKTNHV